MTGASNHNNNTARLDGVRVAVTGGTSGLGLALVDELVGRGARVAFVARTRERVEEIAQRFSGTHGIVGDVARKDDIYPIALQISGTLGGLDVLVNNASSLGPVPLAPLADTDCEDLELALATNLVGPFRLTKALLGALAASAREGRGAVVLNVSSDAAVTPYPLWGAYGASKAALHHLSRIWNEELAAEGVRVLSLDPGDMDTPLHAIAMPDADPATLKRPEVAARELAGAIAAALPVGAITADGEGVTIASSSDAIATALSTHAKAPHARASDATQTAPAVAEALP
jgi:NAD(P)-dependent dehydrogenase (short-subunit alcohol dehydrogenase family)